MKMRHKVWQTLETQSTSIIILYQIQIPYFAMPELLVGIIKRVNLNKDAKILKLDIAAVSAFQFIIDENQSL